MTMTQQAAQKWTVTCSCGFVITALSKKDARNQKALHLESVISELHGKPLR